MTATGVPPTVFQHKQMDTLGDQMKNFGERLQSMQNSISQMATSSSSPAQVHVSVGAPPGAATVISMAATPSSVQHAVAMETVTPAAITPATASSSSDIPPYAVALQQQLMQLLTIVSTLQPASPVATAISTNSAGHQYSTFVWSSGNTHMVPEGFEFPAVTVKTLWNLWWEGVPKDNIAPYRLLTLQDIPNVSAQKVRFSRAGTMMAYLVAKAKELNLVDSVVELEVMCVLELDSIFNKVYKVLDEDVAADIPEEKHRYKRRLYDCKFTTVVAKIAKHV